MHQGSNFRKEGNNQKASTKSKTNTNHTPVENVFTPSQRQFPTNCSLMLVAL